MNKIEVDAPNFKSYSEKKGFHCYSSARSVVRWTSKFSTKKKVLEIKQFWKNVSNEECYSILLNTFGMHDRGDKWNDISRN